MKNEKDEYVDMKVVAETADTKQIEDIIEKNEDVWVHQNAAANPHASPECLKKLAEKALERQAKLKSYEHNGISGRSIYATLRKVAENKKTPPETLEKLSKCWSEFGFVKRLVAENPNTPPHVLTQLVEDEFLNPFLVAVAGNPSSPPELLRKLANPKYEPLNDAVWRQLCENPSTPPEIVVEVMEKAKDKTAKWTVSSHVHERYMAAASPFTQPENLSKLVASVVTKPQSKGWTGEGLHVSPITWVYTRTNDLQDMQMSLSENPNTPPADLAALAASPYARKFVAGNRSTPPETLAKLAMEEDQRVAEILEGNPNLPAAALAKWAKHGDEWNRAAAAQHPNTPPEVLEKLAGDEDEVVSQLARRRLAGEKTPVILTQEAFGKVRSIELGENKSPIELARRIRVMLTYNPQTADWLEQNQPILDIRLMVYANYDSACLDEFEVKIMTKKEVKRILCDVDDTEGAGDVKKMSSDAYYTRLWKMWVALWGKKQETNVVPKHCQVG